jgi:two-component system KDP operon response regulator KdpE
MIHVLAVDDEPHMLRALVMNLSQRGYLVSTATTGAAALESAIEAHPDLMILDLGLPDIDGLAVIESIRKRLAHLPILVLSARTGSADKIAALDLGANDYLTKPFDMHELVARLRAISRRANLTEPTSPVELGRVVVDLADRTVRRKDVAADAGIHLTPTEWRMLEVLLRRPGGLTTPTELLTAMRGSPDHTERSYLRIYMQQLRRKLEDDPAAPRYLVTEPGLGYRYIP